MRHYFLVLLVLGFASWVQAANLDPRESTRIEFLISSVASLQDAQFIRNGSAFGPKAAADHLRLKLKRAGSAVKSAEDFIRYCGTQSSTSGKAYEIRYSDGRVVLSATFLNQKLAEYDLQHPR
jgi:hypothetical protein